jgi:hypothetical protein
MSSIFRLQATGRLRAIHLIDFGYEFGSTPSEELVLDAAPERRTLVLTGVAADKEYSVAVAPYRKVDTDINPKGVIKGFQTVLGDSGLVPNPSVLSIAQIAISLSGLRDAAAAAQSDATAVIARVNSISNDAVLDRSEKTDVIARLASFTAERPGIVSTANTIGIITEATAYTNAYNTLTTYLSSLIPAFTDTSTDTPIVRATFDLRFNDYLAARQTVLNKTASVASTLSTWAGVGGVGKPSDYATSDLLMAPSVSSTGAVTVLGNTLTKTLNNEWKTYLVSKQSYTNGAVLTFSMTGRAMVGLTVNTDSAAFLANQYQALSYSIYSNLGNVQIYEGVSNPFNLGTAMNGVTFTDSTVWQISYNGVVVKYFANSVLMYTHTVPAGLTLYAGYSPYSVGSVASGISFTAGSDSTWASVGGVGRPSDNATSDITLNITNGSDRTTVLGNTAWKNAGNVAWDCFVMSKEYVTGNAVASFTLPNANTISVTGLCEVAPSAALISAGTAYTVITYGIRRGTGSWNVIEGFTNISLGTVYNGVTFTAATVWTITYDGVNVTYYADGVAMRTIAAVPNKTYYAATALYTNTTTPSVANIKFNAYTDNNWASVGGANKPADNATKNVTTYNSTAPASPTDGDIWVDTSITPNVQRLRIGGAWQLASTVGAVLGLNGNLMDQTGTLLTDSAVKNNQSAFAALKIFSFDNDVNSFTVANGTITSAGGILTLVPTASDPIISSPVIGMAGSAIPIIRIRARPKAVAPSWQGAIFYETSGHGFSGAYYKQIANPGLVQNQWYIFEWDMSTQTIGGSDYISNTINRIRIDLTDDLQSWDIDWIALGTTSLDVTGVRGIADGATVGAPAGTLVGNTIAETVEKNAANSSNITMYSAVAGAYTFNGNMVTKIGGGEGWTSSAFSQEYATGTAQLSFKMPIANAFVGLTTTPTISASSSFGTINYAWQWSGGSSNWQIVEGGSAVFTGTSFGAVTFSANTFFIITYDGKNIKYWADAVLVRTVAATDSRTFYVGVSLNSIGTYVSNISFGSYVDNSLVNADPAARINVATTTIDPGKILISGTTTLSNWRNGADVTKIEGGSIAANTIDANKLTIGNRGITMSGIQFQANWSGSAYAINYLYWTGGTVSYVNNSNVATTVSVSSGSISWGSGISYVYWVQGATTLSNTSVLATAYANNNVVVATYAGGVNLNTTYGRTIIDGSQITTGTIVSSNIAANAIQTANIAANAVLASKIAITDFTNFATNGDLSLGNIGWAGMIANDPTNAYMGNYVITLPGGAGAKYISNDNVFTVKPGDQFYLEWWGKAGSTMDSNFNVYLRINNAAGGQITTTAVGSITAADQVYRLVSGNITIPALAYNAYLQVNYNNTVGTGYIGMVRMRRKNEGSLIVDGAISAQKLVIGQRGVDIASLNFQANYDMFSSTVVANRVSWNTGTISYTNDAGVAATATIPSGASNFVAWTSGIIYLYWTIGTTTISNTTSNVTAYASTNIVLATYAGGTNLNVSYGGTVIDGSKITTGTIDANKLIANSVMAGTITVGGVGGTNTLANAFNSASWAGVTGTGKPDSYATVGDNLISNSDVKLDLSGWGNGAAITRKASTAAGDPATAYISGTGTNIYFYGNDRTPVAMDGGKYVYMSCWVRSTLAGMRFSLYLMETNSSGVQVVGSNIGFTATAANTWYFFSGKILTNVATAGVYPQLQAFLSGNATSFTADFALPRYGKTELNSTSGAPAGTYVGTQLAESLVSDVAAATAAIGNISNDNMLSINEKSDIIREWNRIDSSRTNLGARLAALNLSRTTLDSAYGALQSYLVALTPSWSDTTLNTPIVGATFRQKFQDFYAQETAAISTITGTAATLSTWVGVTGTGRPADNATVGATAGTNLLDSTGQPLTDGTIKNSQANYQPIKAVTFDNSVDGCSFLNATAATAGGTITVTATTTNPIIITSNIATLGSLIPIIRMRARPLSANPTFNGNVFYETASANHGQDVNYRKIIPNPGIVQNQWSVFEWDMSTLTAGGTDWMTQTITLVRFDIGASNQQVWEIDWISFGAILPAGTMVGSTLASSIEAQTLASTASLAAITSDNILAAAEKGDIIREWQRIDQTKANMVIRADALSVSRTDYVNAYNAAATYLLSLTPAWNDVSSNTTIVGTTFRQKFADYYTQEALLSSNLTANAATVATWAGTTGAGKPADNATVGAPVGTYVGSMLAENVITTLGNISSDGILSKSEKSVYMSMYAALKGSYLEAGNTSTGFVTTFGSEQNLAVRQAADTAYNALNTYLNGLTPAWNDAASDTAIDPAVFRQNFQALVDAVQALAISNNTISSQKAVWSSVAGDNKPADNAGANFTLYSTGSTDVVIQGNSVTRTVAGVDFSSIAASREYFFGMAYASFMLPSTAVDAGLTTNGTPTTRQAANYTWHNSADGGWRTRYGLVEINHGTTANGVTFTATTLFTIIYDGTKVSWLADGVVMRTVPIDPGLLMKLVVVIGKPNAFVTNIQFGPFTDNAWASVGGANRPADNATVGAPVGTLVGSTAAATVELQAGNSGNLTLYDPSGTQYSIFANRIQRKAGGSWSGNIFSREYCVGTAQVSGSLAVSDTMVGLSDGRENASTNSYSALDYAWHWSNDGSRYFYENGTGISAGTALNGVTFDQFTLFVITYDGVNIKYYANGVLMRTVATTAGRIFFAGASIGAIGQYVAGISLSTNVDNSLANADPAARINQPSATTTINPGKISIQGSTTLADWKAGPNLTTIAGGAIEANTVAANKMSIGLRGVDIQGMEFTANWNGSAYAANVVYWSAGSITFWNDAGAAQVLTIAAGTATWTTGVLYIYWPKNSGSLLANVATTSAYAVDNIVIGTYAGGTNMVINYGRTVVDGSKITAGTIQASQIAAGGISANNLYIGATTEGLVANGGGETGTSDGWIGQGSVVAGGNGSSYAHALPPSGSSGYGSKAFPVTQGKTYAVSWSHKGSAAMGGLYFRIAYATAKPTFTVPVTTFTDLYAAGAATTSWVSYSYNWTAPVGAQWASIFIYNTASTGTAYFDDIQVFEVVANTRIADGAITTTKMVAGTINGDRITAGTLSADRIQASTIMSNLVQIKGVENLGNIGDAISRAADPAARINLTTTTIDGGKITTGTLDAQAIKAGTVLSNLIQVSSTGFGATFDLGAAMLAANDPANRINNVTTTIDGGKITANSVDANRIKASTILAGTITVSGTALSTTTTNATLGASDPAGRINTGTTAIDPGKITIQGSTTLANWKAGPNLTTIAGGAIEANTVAANKITIGSRGLNFEGIVFEVKAVSTSPTELAWSGGYMQWTNDAGAGQATQITGGSTFGYSKRCFVYWTKGETSFRIGTTAETIMADQNSVMLGTYMGGTDFYMNFGSTIINGNRITTGSITADQIAANSITAGSIAVGAISEGLLLNGGAESGNTDGWTGQGFVLAGGNGSQFNHGQYPNSGNGYFSKAFPVTAGRTYMFAYDLYGVNAFFRVSWSGSKPAFNVASSSGQVDLLSNGGGGNFWQSYNGTWTAPSGANWVSVILFNVSTSANIYWDNIQVFEQVAGVRIKNGTITADKLIVTSLSAINANVGEVTAGVIRNADNTTNLNLNNGDFTFNVNTFKLNVPGVGLTNPFYYDSGVLNMRGVAIDGGTIKNVTISTSKILGNAITTNAYATIDSGGGMGGFPQNAWIDFDTASYGAGGSGGSGGGGSGGGGGVCPVLDTPILLANDNHTGPGSTIIAGELRPGVDWVWTQHETTMEWGAFMVTHARVVKDVVVYAATIEGNYLRATFDHPVWMNGRWTKMYEIANTDGRADVISITIDDAHTYISNGILSHNKIANQQQL